MVRNCWPAGNSCNGAEVWPLFFREIKMAMRLEYWRNDGENAHSEIRHVRLRRFDRKLRALMFEDSTVQTFDQIILQRPNGCTLITVRRTDGQNPTEHIIWHK